MPLYLTTLQPARHIFITAYTPYHTALLYHSIAEILHRIPAININRMDLQTAIFKYNFSPIFQPASASRLPHGTPHPQFTVNKPRPNFKNSLHIGNYIGKAHYHILDTKLLFHFEASPSKARILFKLNFRREIDKFSPLFLDKKRSEKNL